MKKSQVEKEYLWQKQGVQLRNPIEIYGATSEQASWNEKSLKYNVKGDFNAILKKLNQTLLVSREYEHLLTSYSIMNGKLRQGFLSLPHPSGIAVSPDQSRVYIASTRNPNTIMEFGAVDNHMKRIEDKGSKPDHKFLMPLRSKFFPGAYYFHDLAFIDGELYANSVGQNGVVKIDMNNSATDELFWQIELEKYSKEKLTEANYIQLNSIATGKTFEESFFSASLAKPSKYRPGHAKFPIDGSGVIFNSKSEVVGTGLTRPHSARVHNGEIWVNNSGYGEIGKIVDGKYEAQYKLPGWTRGLKFIGDYAITGYSVVLKKYTNYAPGIDYTKAKCGIAIINTKTNQIEGSIEFPFGNQIFQIETINSDISSGFLYSDMKTESKRYISQHYTYKINR